MALELFTELQTYQSFVILRSNLDTVFPLALDPQNPCLIFILFSSANHGDSMLEKKEVSGLKHFIMQLLRE